uniref:Uncharacterized protein n=1 Tax=Podarcis muralis TaxID=64176 RepID=A0A670IK84_PODMU
MSNSDSGRAPDISKLPSSPSVTSKTPKDLIGLVETIVSLTTFFISFMVPSDWILMNLESYKS